MKPLKPLLLVTALGALASLYWLAPRPAAPAPRVASSPATPATPEASTRPTDATPPAAPIPAADATQTVVVQVPASATPPATASTAAPKSSTRGARLTIPVGAPVPELFPFQAERDTLQQLASTYDPSQIPTIAGYLRHADPRVRDTAINSLVQLGEASAVPYLESAAQTADPETKKRLQEAVTFLKLPSFLDVVAFAKPAQAQP